MVWRLGFLALCIVFLSGCTSQFILAQRALVTNSAVAALGTQYKYGGASEKEGFDCSGLVYYIFHDRLGYKIPRTVKGLSKAGKRIYFFKHPGDLLFFNIGYHAWNPFTWGRVDHVAIYMGNGTMIHAPKTGSTVAIVYNVFSNHYWNIHYKYARRLIY